MSVFCIFGSVFNYAVLFCHLELSAGLSSVMSNSVVLSSATVISISTHWRVGTNCLRYFHGPPKIFFAPYLGAGRFFFTFSKFFLKKGPTLSVHQPLGVQRRPSVVSVDGQTRTVCLGKFPFSRKTTKWSVGPVGRFGWFVFGRINCLYRSEIGQISSCFLSCFFLSCIISCFMSCFMSCFVSCFVSFLSFFMFYRRLCRSVL